MEHQILLNDLRKMRETIDRAIKAIELAATIGLSGNNNFAARDLRPISQESAAPHRVRDSPRVTVEARLMRAEQGSLRDRVLRLLSGDPSRKWDVYMISETLNTNQGGVSPTVSKLVQENLIRRVAAGVYQGIGDSNEASETGQDTGND